MKIFLHVLVALDCVGSSQSLIDLVTKAVTNLEIAMSYVPIGCFDYLKAALGVVYYLIRIVVFISSILFNHLKKSRSKTD